MMAGWGWALPAPPPVPPALVREGPALMVASVPVPVVIVLVAFVATAVILAVAGLAGAIGRWSDRRRHERHDDDIVRRSRS